MKHWRWILTLLFGMLVALASAQTFQRSLPFLARTESGPLPLMSQIVYRWVGSDATNSPVSFWVDRVGGNAFSATTNKPIWDGTALLFYKTNRMYLDSPGLAFDSVNTNYGIMVVGFQNQSSSVGAFITATNGSTMMDVLITPANTVRWKALNVAVMPDDYVFDMLVQSKTVYTNGVSAVDNINQDVKGILKIGEYPTQGTGLLGGGIYEIIVWKLNGISMSASEIAKAHSYAVTTYGISP